MRELSEGMGAVRNPSETWTEAVPSALCRRSLTRATKGSCCWGRAAPPLPAGRAGSRTVQPDHFHSAQSTQNTLLHTCFNHSLRVNMEQTQEMTGWLLTFPPCNAHILRAPTGRLIYQNKHRKKAKLFALILGINYLTSWLKCKQEKLKKELLEVNFPSIFKENNLLKL